MNATDTTAERTVVLHVAESWGAGVRAAVLQFVAATPDIEHHLLRGAKRAEFVALVIASGELLPVAWGRIKKSGVKELAMFGGDLTELVPPRVAARLEEALKR